ncbi:MAG TPA: hypothetical protein VMU66_06725 [Gaiellales bacterium]|nr:hypothetical protein [Gaiellales bacterium]
MLSRPTPGTPTAPPAGFAEAVAGTGRARIHPARRTRILVAAAATAATIGRVPVLAANTTLARAGVAATVTPAITPASESDGSPSRDDGAAAAPATPAATPTTTSGGS